MLAGYIAFFIRKVTEMANRKLLFPKVPAMLIRFMVRRIETRGKTTTLYIVPNN